MWGGGGVVHLGAVELTNKALEADRRLVAAVRCENMCGGRWGEGSLTLFRRVYPTAVYPDKDTLFPCIRRSLGRCCLVASPG